MKHLARICSLALLTGCEIVQPSDLLVHEVKVVRFSQVPYSWIWVKDSSGLKLDEFEMLQIQLSSNTDLIQFAKDESFNLSQRAFYCANSTGDSGKILMNPYLGALGESGVISLYGTLYLPQSTRVARQKNGRYLYVVFVPLRGTQTAGLYRDAGLGQEYSGVIYDHAASPADICIELKGGEMWTGRRFRSNPAIVPHAAIRKALADR